MNKIYIGDIVGTHGIKGEVKLISDFEYKDRVLKKDFPIIMDDKVYYIDSSRPHKIYDLILVRGITNINDTDILINKSVYIDKSNLKLEQGEYLLNDLIGATVIDNGNNLGKVTEILKGIRNNFIKVDDSFLIPLQDQFIIKFDTSEKILYVKKGKELKDAILN